MMPIAATTGLDAVPEQSVRVAYHLYKHLFSIRSERTRKVVAYAERIVLRDARFLVYQAGRERVLRERIKNIHAFVQGEFMQSLQSRSLAETGIREAYYNPYVTSDFIDRSTRTPLVGAEFVICESGRVYYVNGIKR